MIHSKGKNHIFGCFWFFLNCVMYARALIGYSSEMKGVERYLVFCGLGMIRDKSSIFGFP